MLLCSNILQILNMRINFLMYMTFLSYFLILMQCCDCESNSVFIDGRIRLCFNYFVNLS